jgi:hypothetical protein
MSTLEELAERRRALVERSDSERFHIASIYYQWNARSNVTRKTLGILKHPLVLAGLGLFMLKMPWRRTNKMSGWIWKSWRLLRLVQRMWV